MSEMSFDVLIVGAGAAGLMAAATAVKRGQKVALIDHNKVPGKKILISGGGRCNFTNLHEGPHFYQSSGKNFFKKPLASYRPKHFIELVKKHRVPFHEKTLGQLFCKKSSSNILELLLKECNFETGEGIYKFFGQKNLSVSCVEGFYEVKNEHSLFRAQKLIIATGGLSLPSIGASDWGHRVAKQFGHTLVEPRPVLVPFTSLTITKLNL
ncbi:MAG: FAD-dependent oxidoreductase, partial [Bdellovibrionota bacterium]|nr:FAD-dependent oxidoreductase [Bdellovibrionota bacterium]